MKDVIREKIAQRAKKLGWTAYRIELEAKVRPGTVKRFLDGYHVHGKWRTTSLTSRNLSKVLKVLGLEIRAKE